MRSSSLILLGSGSIALAGVVPVNPLITPAPTIEKFDLRQRQDDVDLGSLAEVLLTGVPPSILALALTNIPAVSRLLWSEFLDDNTPSWFTALPTDVQAYLSGEFGPTTAASNSASATVSSSRASSTVSSSISASSSAAASATAVADTSDDHSSGLPMWAKILIGVLVPLFVLGLLACLLLFCLRRRRSHRRRRIANTSSRAPTPAFISPSHRAGAVSPPGEQHVPLRGGYYSAEGTEPGYQASRSSHHLSSGSDEYRTPIGGPSYEDIAAPVVAAGAQHPRRNSRHSSKHSLSSLHSVPEMPEPMHNPHNDQPPIPLPPRSSHRSRDLIQDAAFGGGHVAQNNRRTSYDNNSVFPNGGAQHNPYLHQGIYAGGHNPYLTSPQAGAGERPYSDPFSDPSSARYSAYSRNSAHSGTAARDPELFLNEHGAQQHQQDQGSSWPLPASQGGRHPAPARTKSYDRYYEKPAVYEM